MARMAAKKQTQQAHPNTDCQTPGGIFPPVGQRDAGVVTHPGDNDVISVAHAGRDLISHPCYATTDNNPGFDLNCSSNNYSGEQTRLIDWSTELL